MAMFGSKPVGRPRKTDYDTPHNARYANPERQRELQRRKSAHRYAHVREWLQNIKSEMGCQRCEEKDSVVLDIHHMDPNNKGFSVSQYQSYAKQRVLDELAQCTVLCANCHRRATFGEIPYDTWAPIDISRFPYPNIPPPPQDDTWYQRSDPTPLAKQIRGINESPAPYFT